MAGRRLLAGFTLVELIVVLAVMGLMLGISGLALASLRLPRESQWINELSRARAEAIRTGRPVRTVASHAPQPTQVGVLFLPDGRAMGPGVDALTGAPAHATP